MSVWSKRHRGEVVLALLCGVFTLAGCPDTDTPPPTGAAPDMSSMADLPGCSSTCLIGEQSCLNALIIQSCVQLDNGCFAFGNPERCTGGGSCSGDMCQAPDNPINPNPDECSSTCAVVDGPRCNARGEVEQCRDHNNDGCVTYDAAMACPQGEVCSKGQCSPPSCPANGCTLGETRCDRDQLQTCQTLNGCPAFGPAKDCGSGEACMGGNCIAVLTCQDECVAGERLCGPDGTPRVCRDGNGNGCVEFVEASACAQGEECRAGSCVAVETCQDRCILGQGACSPGGERFICQPSAFNDGCTDIELAEDCSANGRVCDSSGGSPTCVAVMPAGKVVINEILYDSPGPDVDPATMTSNSFIELAGPAGKSIAGWQIRLVNGNGGATYRTITLPPDAALDGYGYAVITTDKPSNFFTALAFTGNNIYDLIPSTTTDDGIQNGPDNVELYDDMGAKIDALGYGTFGAIDVFTGEGMSAPGAFAGRSLGRLPGAPDTDNNAADFFSLFPTPGLDNADLVINELYVDQPGDDGIVDNMETFIELASPIQGWIDLDLRDYNLRGISGSDGSDYLLFGANPGVDFSGARLNDVARVTGSSGAEGFVLICNIDASSVILDRCSVPYEGVDFRDGPDNIVLEYRGRTIDAVAYGTFGANNVRRGEGNPAPFTAMDAGKSLNRWPLFDPTKQRDTGDNATDFHLASPSPASDNNRP